MLSPILDKEGKTPLYMQIRLYVIEEINAGHLKKGDKLPSVRGLAKHLGLSCTTIENAFNQLCAEGYIDSRPSKGYFVEAVESVRDRIPTPYTQKNEKKSHDYMVDFAGEYIAANAFDFRLWKKHVNHVLNYEQEQLCAYGSVRGELELREAISRQFYRSRGVVAVPEQIVVGGGVTPLLSMLSKLFQDKEIKGISLENPGFRKAFSVFKASGMEITSLDVSFDGINVEKLYESDARACYVSPSHHFPTGFIMPVNERQNILKWATLVDGYIIEDDYNFELRFEGQPIPAMQGMDRNERVIYLGSFSTVLAPAIRISFMVLPRDLNELFEQSESMFPQTASKIEQLALAKLIDSGDFEKHVKKIRKIYTRKQQSVLACLEKHMPTSIVPMKVKSGLQILLKLPEGMSEEDIIKVSREEGVHVQGLSDYRWEEDVWDQYLILSYRGVGEDELEDGIKRIAKGARHILGSDLNKPF